MSHTKGKGIIPSRLLEGESVGLELKATLAMAQANNHTILCWRRLICVKVEPLIIERF